MDCVCDMQISYKMVSNAHVRQLTVPLSVLRPRSNVELHMRQTNERIKFMINSTFDSTAFVGLNSDRHLLHMTITSN